MASLLWPGIEAAAEELGPALQRAGAALLGGTAAAGTASLSSDTSKDGSKAAPIARTLPRTDESCKKCPPEQTGRSVRRNHSMSDVSREYQGRITGRPYSVAEGWSEEWDWHVDFDGFKAEACLLQEAKANYDQFLDDDGEPKFWFSFNDTIKQINQQGRTVRANPPAKLMWYFMTPKAREFLLPLMDRVGVPSVYQP